MSMKRTAFKKLAVVSTISAFVVSGALLTNTVFASEGKKNIEIFFRNIQIMYNNKKVAIDANSEPFILNESTYIPLRYMGEVFNKQVDWDPNTNTIRVSDKNTDGISTEARTIINELNGEIKSLQSKLNAADAEVAEKEKQIDALEKQVETLRKQLAEADEIDLDDLEDELNDDYSDFEDTNGRISLDGDEDDITVTIKLDASAWEKLSSSKQESYLEDIVEDILDEAEDADITGTVKSKSDSRTLVTFYVDDDEVVIDDFDERLKDLEEALNDDYGDYENIDLTISLSGDADDITIKITVNEADWDDLTSSEKNNLYYDLIDEVEKEFEDADVEGGVYSPSGKKLASFVK